MISLSPTDLSFLCWNTSDSCIPNRSYAGHEVCPEVALWVFSTHSRIFSWPSYFSKTDNCFSYLEHCCLKGLVWWFDTGFGEPLVSDWYCWIWMLFCSAVFLKKKKKVRFLNLKSSFSNKPWKRKPLYVRPFPWKWISNGTNLKYGTLLLGVNSFFQMAFKHLYEMHVCVYWELATQHMMSAG